jgi:hypothetical protein
MDIFSYVENNRNAHSLFVGVILTILLTTTTHPTQAKTGKGKDVFKVILTIFGVDKSKGDIVAIVTANNGEASRVKFLDSEAPYVVSMANPNTPGAEGGLVEYVATFPNITVNSGAEYNTCVMTTKILELSCKTGHNSPALRPEFVDINLNEISVAGTERLETVEQQAQIEEQD